MTNVILCMVTVALTVSATLAFRGLRCTTDEDCADYVGPTSKCVQDGHKKKCIDCPCQRGDQCRVTCTVPWTVACECPPDTAQPVCEPTCQNPLNPCGINTICFDDNGTAAASCTCESGYTGNPVSEEGCNQVVDLPCGGDFTGESGTFRHPVIPGTVYENNEDCSWTITTTPFKILKITFLSFDVENSATCYWDRLWIYDGDDDTSDPLLAEYCGRNIIPPPVISTQNQLYLRFTTDSSVIGYGFELHWTSHVP